MTIAIHENKGTFSDSWIELCKRHSIDYIVVDCFSPGIIEQLQDADALLWNWLHYEYDSQLFARQLTYSIETMGKTVFPSSKTCWHYDDKVGQKYLLESIGAPLIPTWVFYHEDEVLRWIQNTSFPKVFKLRCGAGSKNVRLVKSENEAVSLCKTAFGEGFPASAGYFADSRAKLRSIKNAADIFAKLKRMPRSLKNIMTQKQFLERQRGYVYFQEFIPGNSFDTRITIIGNRAFGFTRNTRPDDFRASGSGDVDYSLSKISKRCISIAFEVARKLQTQSLALDFLFDKTGIPLIGEISYSFVAEAVYRCYGYWDTNFNFHEGNFRPEELILEDLINAIK
jgi:glutathione synthase/RimK-type ligase-like ATP-grasp enzyme